MKKGCRLCEQEVLLDELRDHSFKCKDLSDLKDNMDTLNMQILTRIHEAMQLKFRLAHSVPMNFRPDLTNYQFIEDLSKSNRALERVLAYGNKIQHENFIDYDNENERELIEELDRLRKEVLKEDISGFLFLFSNLIEEKKRMKMKMGKLDMELKKTLGLADNMNPDAVKQMFFNQKSKSFKHQKKSPKLFGNLELKQQKSETKDAQGQTANLSIMSRLLEKSLGRKLPTIDEIDSATGTPSMHGRLAKGQLKQMSIHKGEIKSLSESPNSQGSGDLNINFSTIFKTRMNGTAQSTFSKQKLQPVAQIAEQTEIISSYLNQNLIPTKPSPILGKEAGLSSLHNRGPLKATDIYRSPKLNKEEEASPLRRPNLLNLVPELNTSPGLKDERSRRKEQKKNGKAKRPNSVTLFNQLEGEEKYQMNRFPSLSREASPTKLDEEKPPKKPKVKTPFAEEVSPKAKSPGKIPLALIRNIAFGEDVFVEGEKRREENPPEERQPEESSENFQNVYYEAEILKGYNSDTNTRNDIKKHSVIDNACITDFHFIKMISKGGFGKVWLVKHNKTQDLYAMKIIDSEEKMNENRILSLEAEKNVFKLLQGDYVVKAVFTFTHENYICFVMEYVIGGDFGGLLERCGFFDEEVGRFYIGEIILAIESMHKINVVHRDLKPDNILIDSRGHIKLADFGLSQIGLDNRRQITTPVMKTKKLSSTIEKLAKKKMEKFNQLCDPSGSIDRVKFIFKNPTSGGGSMNESPPQRSRKALGNVKSGSRSRNHTSEYSKTPPFHSLRNSGSRNSSGSVHRAGRMVGTPDYMAPEVIAGENCTDVAIDWWAVGVILYEFLIGVPPFNGDSIDEIFENITNMRIEWPKSQAGGEYLSPNARDLIERLLTKDPKSRLGTKSADEIKSHEFFKGFDWDHLRDNPAPIKPIIVSETDISNFEKESKKLDEEEKQNPFKPRNFEQKNEWTSKLDLKKFQMKRRDLLHQLNLEDYEKYKNQGKEPKKDEGEKRRKLVRGYTTEV